MDQNIKYYITSFLILLATDTSLFLWHSYKPAPTAENGRLLFLYSSSFVSLSLSYGTCTFKALMHQFISLTHTQKNLWNTHTKFLSFTSFHVFSPSPLSFLWLEDGCLPPASFRSLLDVVLNTVGAVRVIYGRNPNAAAWHGCQLPWETTWFILCCCAYGLIKVTLKACSWTWQHYSLSHTINGALEYFSLFPAMIII